MVAEMSEKSSLALYRDINFSWDKIPYTACCTRQERSGIAWLLALPWKMTTETEIKK
jgi:hypothetical protein